MKTKWDKPKAIVRWTLIFLLSSSAAFASTPPYEPSADRAVEIAKRSRDRIERNGQDLKTSSDALFTGFAQQISDLQKLIDTRQQLESSGFLTKGDPDGDARRAHLNSKILMEVGELKEGCDSHLDSLLRALERFDRAVADSLVDSQATRSINSNYELSIQQYLKQEKTRFSQAAGDAQSLLEQFQDAETERDKKRLLKKYKRAKKRLVQIEQRRKLYEARMKVAAMNHKITGLIRERIREQGHDIPSRFRDIMAGLYNTFAKITPVAEIGGTGKPEFLSGLGFANVDQMQETLNIVDGAISKLGTVLDSMVDEVIGGLGDIQVVSDGNMTTESFSAEEEMEFLRNQRQGWSS